MAQGHLNSLGDAFHEISKTNEGQVLLGSMEGLATRIKVGLGAENPLKTTCNGYFFQTEGSFKDAVKVCFRLAKEVCFENPWSQFGLFLGLFGLLVFLMAEFGVVAVLGTTGTQVLRFKEKCVSKYFLKTF